MYAYIFTHKITTNYTNIYFISIINNAQLKMLNDQLYKCYYHIILVHINKTIAL